MPFQVHRYICSNSGRVLAILFTNAALNLILVLIIDDRC